MEELSFDDLWGALSDDHYNKEVQYVPENLLNQKLYPSSIRPLFGRYIGALKTVEKLKDTDLGEGMPNPKTI